MKLIDKLLLGLLVILIPFGIFIAQWFFFKPETLATDDGAAVDLNALEQLIKQTMAQNQPTQPKKESFTISAVSYASESGILKISGKAPTGNSNILVSASLIPKNTPEPSTSPATNLEEESDTKTGLRVEFYATEPDSQGVFSYSYQVPEDARQSQVELRLDQNQVTSTIRFDLVERKQVY